MHDRAVPVTAHVHSVALVICAPTRFQSSTRELKPGEASDGKLRLFMADKVQKGITEAEKLRKSVGT